MLKKITIVNAKYSFKINIKQTAKEKFPVK